MLSATVQHALRALSVLAGLPDGAFILGRDLAKRAGIPANYLSKILWTLGGAGFIDATRGSGGGYRLQKSPKDIHLADIVCLFERHRIARGCLLDSQKKCSDADACAAHRSWQAVGDAMINFLENTTLADIAPHQEPKN
ncbi:MAG: Rrf2 family transcriptional regulator [Bryobacterales bacterium]|nr:Rrf2 family transcriptional regulator [Bryobacterales bacterium]